MTARAVRHTLADALRAARAHAKVSVYASPPEAVASPALVIAPRQPYRSPTALSNLEEMNLRIVATVPRTSGSGGLDLLDDLLDSARAVVRATPGFRWQSVENVGLTVYTGGSELLSGVLDITADIADAPRAVITLPELPSGGVLPDGSATRDSLRWNVTASAWEAFSSVSTWYYALTPDNVPQPIAAVLKDALLNGFNNGLRRSFHYDSSIGEVVLGRRNLPGYPIDGDNSWESDGDAHAVSVFGVDEVYHWIILPADVSGSSIANRFWTIEPRSTSGGGSRIEPGVLDATPAYTETNENLIVNGVTYRVARARITWVPGTVNHNFRLRFVPKVDAPTVVWQAQ